MTSTCHVVPEQAQWDDEAPHLLCLQRKPSETSLKQCQLQHDVCMWPPGSFAFHFVMRIEEKQLEDSPTSQATLEFNASFVLLAAYLQSMPSQVCLAMWPSWHRARITQVLYITVGRGRHSFHTLHLP